MFASLPPVVCLIYVMCACLNIMVSNIYCVLFFFSLCTLCCQFLWIKPFLIAPSVFSNVYFIDPTIVLSVVMLSCIFVTVYGLFGSKRIFSGFVVCSYRYCRWRSRYQEKRVDISLTGLVPQLLCQDLDFNSI